ncbi:MAG: type II CRISPR RNA-guided endonuclease Cas9, partial [Ginsengibacter sp.]
ERKDERAACREKMEGIVKKYQLNINFDDENTIRRFLLWQEQKEQCLYCNDMINCADIFDGNTTQLEHTIPAGLSFCDELWNLTIAHTHCNQLKNKRIPKDLGEQYSSIIEDKIKFISEKKEHFGILVNEALARSKKNKDNKEKKDSAIQDRHYYLMHFDYWNKKFETFTIDEYKPNWHNRQLKDTQTSTKYALHWLKSYFKKVDVQRGEITFAFREIFGLPEKDRNQHSHHAMDAAVLCCIPNSLVRENYLKAYFECKDDNMKLNRHWFFQQHTRMPYKTFKEHHYLDIQNTTLINNMADDRTFVQAKKYFRKRGKKVPLIINKQAVYLKDEHGNILYKKHRDGSLIYKRNSKGELMKDDLNNYIPIPIKKYKLAEGSTIRGQLHNESIYGAILKSKLEDGKPVMEDGKFIYEDRPSFVKRVHLQVDTIFGFKKKENEEFFIKQFNDIVDPVVRDLIVQHITNRLSLKVSQKDVFKEPVWMLNKNGEKIHKIRHVRVDMGNINPTEIKRHEESFLSKHKHKRFKYADNATNTALCCYKGLSEEKETVYFYNVYTLFDLAETKQIPQTERQEGIEYVLEWKLKPGQKIILQRSKDEDIQELEKTNKVDFLKRIYRTETVYPQFSNGHLYHYANVKYHLEARRNEKSNKENKLPKPSGKPNFEAPFLMPLVRVNVENSFFVIEGKHFEIEPSGEINWLF